VTAPVVLLLAAGASARMGGRDKLLETVDGQPLLRRQAIAALASGTPVTVVLPPGAHDRAAALAGLGCQTVIARRAKQGMGHSLAVGAASLPAGTAALILPADMPDIGTDALNLLIAAHDHDPAAILRGATGSTPGHPVLIPADLVPALTSLDGDTGARQIVAQHPARISLVPLPGAAATTDLDTPAAWAAWRQTRT